MEGLKDKIRKLPKNPGIYIFKDKAGKVLYVGKAANLKNRVSSYFSRNVERLNIDVMMPQVSKFEAKKTDSVLEALILESNLIKKYQPKYNMRDKDDKSFSYFTITKEDFPRIIILRETDLNKNKAEIKFVFGPYTSKNQMEKAIKIIKKVFPFHSAKQKTEKGCLDYQIGRCPGPHAGDISKKDYKKNIQAIIMILRGKKNGLLKKMEKEMNECAEAHEFEKAADLRNKIFSLRHIQDVALISDESEKLSAKDIRKMRIEAYDISNISGRYAVGSMIVFENHEPDNSQYRKFRIKTVGKPDDVAMMKEILSRRFKNNWKFPNLIILDGGRGHLNMGIRTLKEFNLEIPIVAAAKGPTRKKLELKITNHELGKEINNILKNRKLIKKIMDEAHRFAISYHRKLRGKI